MLQINVGVIQENPASTAGAIRILDKLHEYVPIRSDGSLYTVLCHGDELTVERQRDAKLARACSASVSDIKV